MKLPDHDDTLGEKEPKKAPCALCEKRPAECVVWGGRWICYRCFALAESEWTPEMSTADGFTKWFNLKKREAA